MIDKNVYNINYCSIAEIIVACKSEEKDIKKKATVVG